MPEITKTYSGQAPDKMVTFQIDENVLGLNQHTLLKDLVSEDISNDVKRFVFDLTNLNTVNSSGLGILISCLKKIKDSDCSLKIVNANDKIIGIFKLTKLNNVFEFDPGS